MVSCVVASVAFTLLGQAKSPQLVFDGAAFVLTENGKKTRAVLSTPNRRTVAPVARVQFRKDATFVVWDNRGLNLRVGNQLVQTRCQSLLNDKSIQSSDQLTENRTLTATGNLSTSAMFCMASRRFGDQVFMILRFPASGNFEHRDYLIEINLAAQKPGFKPLARLAGPYWTGTFQPDTISIVNNQLRWIEAGLRRWSLAAFDLKTKKVRRESRPATLLQTFESQSALIGFVEANEGTIRTVGRADLRSFAFRNLAEIRSESALLDLQEPWVAISNDNGRFTLHNLSTGSRMSRGTPTGLMRLGRYVVVYAGSPKPTNAVLLDPMRWVEVATWSSKSQPQNAATSTKKPTPEKQKPKTSPTAKP